MHPGVSLKQMRVNLVVYDVTVACKLDNTALTFQSFPLILLVVVDDVRLGKRARFLHVTEWDLNAANPDLDGCTRPVARLMYSVVLVSTPKAVEGHS